MEKEKVLSVVIPAYNAEKYIGTALDSFCIDEFMDDFEVIVVNDGSTDKTGAVAQEFCVRFPGTFRLINKPNGGHGSGINCGIKLARGRYFKVVDADDWVDKKAFGNLVRYLREAEADIVWSGFYWVYDRGDDRADRMKKKAEMEIPFMGVEYQRVYAFDEVAEKIYIKMHNMTIRTAILREHGVHIDEHCYYVDSEFILYPIPYVKTIAFLRDFVYMYRIGVSGQSMSREKMKQNEESVNRVLRSLFRMYRKLGGSIPVSQEALCYIENLIARIVAGKYRIMLCRELSEETCARMKRFDDMLRRKYPRIYRANINKAVKVLRRSDFRLYASASVLCKLAYH